MYESNVSNYVKHAGKVRDVYELGESMLIIVTTDRISAFDYVFPNTVVPDKGRILQAFSLYWTDVLDCKYHLISTESNHIPHEFRGPEFAGRAMLVEKAEVIPFECVVRGYLCGSAWKEYKETGEVCGIKLPKGLKENQQFPKPIFTPATKAKTGHDENVSFEYMSSQIGIELAVEIEALSLELYQDAAEIAWKNGIIIADTKFEWGAVPQMENQILLVDEVLTPDSSRFWPLDEYKLNCSISSFDKQYVRDWIAESGWDKSSVPPPLPEDVVTKTSQKYIEAYEKITGQVWK